MKTAKLATSTIIACLLMFQAALASDVVCKIKILSDNKINNLKRSVEIEIDRRISAIELEKLAQKIKRSDGNNYERTFILYYLPYQKPGAGAWATTHFNPFLKVEVEGTTIEGLRKLRAHSIKQGWQVPEPPSTAPRKWGAPQSEKLEYGGEIVGEWIWDLARAKITIFKKNGMYMMNTYFLDGGESTKTMNVKKVKRGLRLKDQQPNAFKEYFIVNKNRWLEFYDEDHDLARKNILVLPPQDEEKI